MDRRSSGDFGKGYQREKEQMRDMWVSRRLHVFKVGATGEEGRRGEWLYFLMDWVLQVDQESKLGSHHVPDGG